MMYSADDYEHSRRRRKRELTLNSLLSRATLAPVIRYIWDSAKPVMESEISNGCGGNWK